MLRDLADTRDCPQPPTTARGQSESGTGPLARPGISVIPFPPETDDKFADEIAGRDPIILHPPDEASF